MNQTTTEEKIDYIYSRLKKQEKTERFSFAAKWIFRILIFGYLYYFITIGLPTMIAGMVPDMTSFGDYMNTPDMQTSITELQDKLGDYFGE